MISERLKQRIANLTGDSMAKISSDPKSALSNRDMQMGATMSGLSKAKGVLSNQDVAAVDQILKDQQSAGMSPQDKEILESMLQRAQQSSMAPMAGQAQELAMQGEGEDTQLAHLRPGEVVLPPEFFEDAKFEKAVENKFKQAGIDPEQAVVGVGIASLNEMTGLEQFGFFKKIGKSLKKVVKKVAPIALPLLIPGVGGALSAGLSSVGSALGIPSGIGSSILGGKGILDTVGGIRGGIESLLGGVGGGQTDVSPQSDVIGMLDGKPLTRSDLANLTPDQIGRMQVTQATQNDKSIMQFLSSKLLPQGVEDALGTGTSAGGLAGLFGGQNQGGGFGNMLMLGGIGALASGLGKLAYEDAKKQKGVPLTPLTTMSPTGRYNIEAEIARRMGQAAPNPVEFGLLPAGTLPELSGGKPRGMRAGGIMAFAEGGAVQMQDGGEMDPSQFPRMDGDINGPGTETSDDIPAMLSDGEFVMTGQAVRGAGAYEMQSDGNGIISLIPSLNEDRERGMDNMYKMMDTFAKRADPS